MAAIAISEPRWRQETGIPSNLPNLAQGINQLGHPLIHSGVVYKRAASEAKQGGIWWDTAGFVSHELTEFTQYLTLLLDISKYVIAWFIPLS